MVARRQGKRMGQTARFQETLRRLAMIDEGFVADEAGFGLDPAAASALDPKTVALLQVAVSVALGRRRSAWNGALAGRWRRVRVRTRSPTCCWRSPRWLGSAGSSRPLPTWRPRWGMTSPLRWRNRDASLTAGDERRVLRAGVHRGIEHEAAGHRSAADREPRASRGERVASKRTAGKRRPSQW